MINLSSLDKEIYKPGEVSKMLGCSNFTLYNREKDGKLKAYYTPSGRRFYKKDDVVNLLEDAGLLYNDNNRIDIIYARVSTYKQKDCGDLKRQIDKITKKVIHLTPKKLEILSDVGSGLNEKRKNYVKLINMVLNNKIDRIFILYKDRLTRFGFFQFKQICEHCGTEVIVLSTEENEQSIEEELAEDIISIIHSFSGKLYGMRKKTIKEKINEVFNDEEY